MTAQQYCRFRCSTVLIDVDTQKDLLLGNGAASVYNHRRVLANIRRVMAGARHEHIPTISTARTVSPVDSHPGFCLLTAQGCKKLRYTIRDKYAYFASSDSTDLPGDLLNTYDQVIFAKRTSDPFDEPRLDRMLSELYASRIYVIGATLEGAVRETVEGLLARGHSVTILIDAVGSRNHCAADNATRKMVARGARLARTTEVLGTSTLRTVHACSCPRCQSAAMAKQPADKYVSFHGPHKIAL